MGVVGSNRRKKAGERMPVLRSKIFQGQRSETSKSSHPSYCANKNNPVNYFYAQSNEIQ
jgi:hypothetical protein